MEDIARTILAEELEALRLSIIENHTAAGQVASGRTRDTLRVEVTQGDALATGTLYGRQFFGTLETGTAPWRKAYAKPPRFFVEIIRQWITDKGLDLNAYLTARKIMLEGSKLHRDGGRDDIYSREVVGTLERIGDRLTALYSQQVTELIRINIKAR